MQNLENKRILFLDGLSNLYHRGIVKAFESMGTSVTALVYSDFMDKSQMGRIKKVIFKKFTLQENKFLSAITGHYDIVFIKNPEQIHPRIFITLKQRFPKARFINYNWNSIHHLDYRQYIPLFDKVYTFDSLDAKKYNLIYYPLFYLPDFEKISIDNTEKEFVISFVGSAYSPSRAEFLSKLCRLIKIKSVSSFLHLYAYPEQYYKIKLFKNYYFNKILSKRYFSDGELLDVYKKSMAFIDHLVVTQNGHTIRTFETLASGLMLVTTNKSLRHEPFFDPERIQIIKEDLSDLDLDMIKEYRPSFPIGFEKYRLDNWLKTILNECC